VIDHPIQPILKTIQTLPGCYIYKDINGKILYVGKAKNLRKRVTSYFLNYRKLTARIQVMIDNAFEVETHTVDSEVEALILEASLIKKYKPKYNVMLKDDKSYSWIKITKDPYPIIYRTRNTNDKNAVYFGPFPDAHARDQVLDFLRKEFPFRTCSYAITDDELNERNEKREAGERVRSRLCTYYHIGRCGGPCEGQVSHDDYLDNINSIKKFLQNRKRVLIHDLESKMKYFASQELYEKAGRVKNQIDQLNYVSKRLMIGHGDDEDDVTRLSFQRSQKGLEKLIKRLKVTDIKPMTKQEKAEYLGNFRIECYDISNIQGTNPVGSMVVFEGGIAKKAHYRKFKINIKETPDDFAMMEEMLRRRFRYLADNSEFAIKQKQKERFQEKYISKDDSEGYIETYQNGAPMDALLTAETSDQIDIANLHTGDVIVDSKDSAFAVADTNQVYTDSYGYEISAANLSKNIVTKSNKQDGSFTSIPDLVIIDGGKGQLGKAIKVFEDLKLSHLKVCGLAKRREEIFLPGEKESYLFDDFKESLFLLQRIRDEAHRFGITYHRLRRSKAMLQ
jgi:excinuclease ABC subunit C